MLSYKKAARKMLVKLTSVGFEQLSSSECVHVRAERKHVDESNPWTLKEMKMFNQDIFQFFSLNLLDRNLRYNCLFHFVFRLSHQ